MRGHTIFNGVALLFIPLLSYNIVTYLALAYVIMCMLVFSNYFQQLTNKNVKKVETVE